MRHLAIAEEFELRRSPRAQVSQAIAAIDSDRAFLVERVLGVLQQLRQRKMNRAAYRGAAMLMIGQHVDDLAALGDDFQDIMMVDDSHI